jgi:RNA polymerase sigma-70 factor (ECF subfamily)
MNGATASVTAARARIDPVKTEEVNALLAKVAASGDRDAFARLFNYFAPRVKGYLMRIGASQEQAEDLAQDVFIKIWRRARLFDPAKASASTWVYTIARNVRIDALRRLNRPELNPSDPLFLPDEEPRADASLERKERDAKVRTAFAALPPNQHDVVALHFFEDEPHSAIAKRLGLPLGTVKSRLRLAFEKIRRELGEL